MNSPRTPAEAAPSRPVPPRGPAGVARQIVAAVVRHGDRLCLLRRSSLVGHDRGLWHCVTGYLEPDELPRHQVEVELYEELNVTVDECRILDKGMTWVDGWNIHVFEVHLSTSTVMLNWEHDAVAWVGDEDVDAYSTVWWLRNIMERVGGA